MLPFCRFQRQRSIKVRVLRAQDFYTPLALKTAKGQHLPALEVYKNQSPSSANTVNSRRPFRRSTWNENLHQRTAIARFESPVQRTVYQDQILCFRGRYDRQRTLVIRIAAMTLASDSAITLARFCPSKDATCSTNDAPDDLYPKDACGAHHLHHYHHQCVKT